MNLRSRDSSSLVPRVEDIVALEREVARKRREEEQQTHFQRLGFEMEHNQNQPHDGVAQGAANLRPQHRQRQARAVGAYDQPHIHGHKLGIRAPAVENNNFDIKSGMLNTIENNKCFQVEAVPFFFGRQSTSMGEGSSKNEISSFQQKHLERFSEAWERFKSYWSQCPHHGFTKESLLSTFYRGALPHCRNMLDTASNGFFLGRTEEEAEELVENMAKSESVYSEEHDRVNRSDDQQTKKEIRSLQDKMDLLLSNQAKQEQMNFVGGPSQEVPPKVNEVDGLDGKEELCFINANGTWPYYNNQQGGYQAKHNYPQANQSPQTQGSSSKAQAPDSSVDYMLKQLLEFQARNEKTMIYEFKNIHAKIDGNYSDLNNKYMQLASHLKALESQVASMPSSSKQPMGSLPGKPEKNPKESCNVVFSTTSLEIELSDHEKEEDEVERLVIGTEFGEVERFVVATDEVKLEEATEVELSPYDKLPFPQRVLTKAQKKALSKFRKDLSDVGVRLPEISGMREAHVQMMLINDILDHQAEVAEILDISILKIDPPIPPKSLPKLESQGMFTLPCYLGIESIEPNTSSLQFGDSSSTTPIGLIKDFPLKIGACTIPIDLTVLKMVTEK
ncbi:uncharacterized protein LOC125590618 [Brassica napus]|uniref:uncharacterized protein LOC125590618 n=1 Tax=Brassica napus TaxID=3708 RepID=UPI00207A1172|nr:uncharacterized protein LOC125590618 [Brassica napus]